MREDEKRCYPFFVEHTWWTNGKYNKIHFPNQQVVIE